MSDLTFNGGATGASMGNQQYTMRYLISECLPRYLLGFSTANADG